MPFSRRQLDALLTPDLIPAGRVRHLSTRIAETYLRRRTFALEDATVKRLHALYTAFYRDLRAFASDEAERRGITKLAGDPAGTAWRDAVVAATERALNELINAVAAEGLRAAILAYQGNFYGRLWLLDMATRADIAIPKTPPPVDVLYRQITQPLLREDAYDDLIRSLMGREWRAQYADQMDGITLDVRRAIGQGLIDGEGIPDVMRRVRTALGVETDRRRTGASFRANFNRVQAITRTVINRVSNEGSVSAYRANSDVVGGYEWLSSSGACPECAALNGTRYGLNDSVRPPAHPNCILPGNVVSLPGTLAGAAKSFYVGKAVEIVCGSGSRITVTQNHPILTLNGWISAKDLRAGQHVIRATNVEGITASVNPDNEYGPAPIEQIFDTFMKARGVSAATVKVAAEDFYGDARFFNGKVDVVLADSFLLSDIQPAITQPVGHAGLGNSCVRHGALLAQSMSLKAFRGEPATPDRLVSSLDHAGAFSLSGSLPAAEHCIRDAARLDVVFQQSSAQYSAADVELARERLFSLSTQIAADNDIEIGNIAANASNLNIGASEGGANSLGINVELACNFIDRFAADVTIDPILSVRVFEFAGHVYDLQVEPYELYICNTVIVKNCRCTTVAIIRDDLLTHSEEPPRASFGEWASGYGMDQTIAQFLGRA